MITSSSILVLGLLWYFAKRKATGGKPAVSTTKTSFNWSESDMKKFVDTVEPLGVQADDALLVYAAESDLNPRATSGIAYGIPQMIESTLKGLGFTGTGKDFLTYSVADQIPWIGKLIEAQINITRFTPKNALDLYVLNFRPASAPIREPIIVRSGEPGYKENKGLDYGNKGYITRGDLQKRLNSVANGATYKAAIALLKQVKGL